MSKLGELGLLKPVLKQYVIHIDKPDASYADEYADEIYKDIIREINTLRSIAVENNIYFETLNEREVGYLSDKLRGSRLFTIKQAAKYLNIGLNSMYGLCKQSDFPVIMIGTKKMIDREALDEWVDVQVSRRINNGTDVSGQV